MFDRYKTKRKEGEEAPAKPQITIAVSNPAAAKKAWDSYAEPVADGVIMARDLINEPANVLYPGGVRAPGVRAEEARRRG